jgi:hypothetical protein
MAPVRQRKWVEKKNTIMAEKRRFSVAGRHFSMLSITHSKLASSIQVSIGSFKFLLNRQNEYVETAIGLGGRDFTTPSPVNVCAVDEQEVRPRAAVAATERTRKVLRLIDVIICPF